MDRSGPGWTPHICQHVMILCTHSLLRTKSTILTRSTVCVLDLDPVGRYSEHGRS